MSALFTDGTDTHTQTPYTSFYPATSGFPATDAASAATGDATDSINIAKVLKNF